MAEANGMTLDTVVPWRSRAESDSEEDIGGMDDGARPTCGTHGKRRVNGVTMGLVLFLGVFQVSLASCFQFWLGC